MRSSLAKLLCTVVVVVGIGSAASAEGFRFPVGLTYMSGWSDVVDFHKDVLHADADFVVPVGLSFAPYYEFACQGRLGLSLGPIGIIMMQDSYGGSSDVTYWDVPIGADCGYSFIKDGKTSPYVRVGFRYHIANGDFVDKSTPGAAAGVGVEFFRKSPIGMGVEVGYDASEVTLRDDGHAQTKVKPSEVTVSLRAIF